MTRHEKNRSPGRTTRSREQSLGGLSITELDRIARALGYLLDVERTHAETSAGSWPSRNDPQGLGFEAFAVGAIERMCELAMRAPTDRTIAAVRYVAALLANEGRHALERGLEVAAILAVVDLTPFRDAGRRSVDACLACETDLSFYSLALREHDVSNLTRKSKVEG